MRMNRFIFAIIATVAFERVASARPEYGLQTGINRCTACHFSASGGGPRNLNGKEFGARGFKINPVLKQEWVGADIKFLQYAPEKSKEVRGGSAVMANNVSFTAPLSPADPDLYQPRILAEQNIGGLGSISRQLYFSLNELDETKTTWIPSQILIGRFIPAFGLLNDEHRVYVRMQTATQWNTGLRMGAQFSGNPYELLHYDVSLLNGQENAGGLSAAGQSDVWGGVLNLRLMNASWPWMIGVSGNSYEAEPDKGGRSAQALYYGLSISRLTGQRVPVEILLEVDQAHNWNTASWLSQFVTDSYATLLDEKDSRGAYALVQWDLNRRWSVMYRYDYLLLDKDYAGDAFTRSGLGFKTWFAPNAWFMARYDKAYAGRSDEEAAVRTGSLDAVWAVLNVGF